MNQSNNQPSTDTELVKATLRGDHAAFTRIVRNTEGLVAGMIYKMVPAPADRQDLAQDVFLRVYKGLAGFRFQSKLSTWIAQVTYNTCLNYLAKKRLVLQDPPDDQLTTAADSDPELLLDRKELNALLEKAISTLPPIYQVMVTLYHREDQSYREIAQVTGLPEGTVKSYLFRARKKLKDAIQLTIKTEGYA